MRNKYYKRSKVSEAKFRQLLRYVALDFTATDTAKLTGISMRSVTHIYGLLRDNIRQWVWQETPFTEIIEVDESYFAPRRILGKRGRGASCKTMVFGIFKRQGKVYIEIVPDARKKSLEDIIQGKVVLKMSFIPMAGEAKMGWWT